MSATRRLAAILTADAAGYSRLVGTDERGTLEQLRAIRNELIDPTIAAHNGRMVKRTGDGFLAEFASSVDALTCAEEIQAQMAERNLASAPESRIDFRMGIHQGDIVVEEDGDIFGDGVNIAARLEGLAEPGGICVSARVQEDAAGKLDLVFRDIGEQTLKNIARPVRVYRVHLKGIERAPAATALTASRLTLAVAPRLSIVVLPFTNLSNDAEQQYFADGITEDLTTDLSRVADMLVISRNTAFTYRNKSIDTKQIGRELGVRYVLEGSVRRSTDRLRVSAQLIDAETDAHLWAERFDDDTADLFALQNEITARIANALDVELVALEAARSIERPDALNFILRGRAAALKPASRDSYAERISMFEHALAADPGSVEAQSRLAGALVDRMLDFGSSTAEADLKRAEELANNAVAASPRSEVAHLAKAQVLRLQRRCGEAIPEYETALALNHNSVAALAAIGRCKIYVGPIEEAILPLERAIRLSPLDPSIAIWYYRIGEAHLLQSHIDDAILWFQKARIANEGLPFVHVYLASAYGLKGETDRAAAELAEARKLSSEGFWSSLARLRANTRYETPTIRALAEATYYTGLRNSGMAEG